MGWVTLDSGEYVFLADWVDVRCFLLIVEFFTCCRFIVLGDLA